ncbi:MAG TPA: tRNA (adenosine(37)-N6)-threonylcarbamoyltransferase complex dimerization subunit type 1 TsaB [Puia sp.]|jgi:tRNA threonylcarbamoyladenosine biosynthesis protein TsaB|nr:tRNA (adenosine(37)-N6)-threonylcarbamoyltransferase complex dimerization subunit type 1 TsaB [Puia sp.]
MALILNIDTATETASISLSKEGSSLALLQNKDQKEHASWLHPAIEKMMQETGFGMKDLQAVAVTAGPGSYTGLRVGMAAAKGFCFALNIPLLTENTLKVMAFAAREQYSSTGLLCPMIDARRLEVFTAIYGSDLVELMPTTAMIIDENSFSTYLASHKVSFFGGGSYKCKPIITAPSAAFIEINYHAGYLGILSFLRYLQHEFTGLAYSEPAYTKEYYTHTRK